MATSPMQNRWGLEKKIAPAAGQVWTGAGVYDSGAISASSDVYQSIESLSKVQYAALPQNFRDTLYRQAKQYYKLDVVPISYMNNFWVEQVNTAAQLQSRTGERVSPIEAFDYVYADSMKSMYGSGPGGGKAAGPTKAVNLTDPDTANTLLDQALSTYIGRAANDTEKQMLRKALKEHELKNPSKTTVQGDTAIKSGGSNSATFAKDFAQQQEGSAEFTAATSLMDTFIDALKAQV